MALRRFGSGGAAARWVRALAPSLVLCGALALAAPVAGLAAETGRAFGGVTLDASGSALSGVEIRVLPLTRGAGALPVMRALSDAEGRFALGALAPGAYRLVAVKGGYAVLVGQIDTVVQKTVELVLRPAAGAAPGANPADGSWTLRLPNRDVLEDAGFDAARANALDGPVLAPAISGPLGMQQLGLDLYGTRLDQDSGGGAFRATAGFESAFGRVRSALAYARDASDDGFLDANYGVQVRWVPESGDPARRLSVDVDVLRRGAESAPFAGLPSEEFDLGATRWAIRDARESAGWSREFRADVLLADVSDQGPLEDASTEWGVARVAAGALVGRAWGEQHVWSAGAELGMTRGALRADEPGTAVLLPVELGGMRDELSDALGDRVALFVGDLWQALPGLAVATRARGEWARGYDNGLRAVPSVEARLTAGPGVVLTAEGGVVLGGAHAGTPLGRFEVAGGRGPILLTASVDRSIGPASWEADAALPSADASSRLAFGPDAVVDRVALAFTLRPAGVAGDLQLVAERIDIDGDLAPRLPHDIAIVPLALDARASTDRVTLAIGLHRIGSSLLVEWEQIDQATGAPVLPGGAAGWDRRAVSVRQRVIAREGIAAFVVVGLEETRLSTEPSTDVSLRTSLLDRRRFSGGMSLTF